MQKRNLIIVIMWILFSCIGDRKTRIPYRSESSKESEKRNTFINEYSFEYEKNPNQKELLIREVWTEKEWELKN